MDKEFEKAIEEATGKTIEYLRDTPIDQIRADAEKAHGKPCQFVSSEPRILTHDEVNAAFDDAIKKLNQ